MAHISSSFSMRRCCYFLYHLYLLSIFQSSPLTSKPASSVLIGPVRLLPWRHGGSYYGSVGVSLKPLRGEKGGGWCSIRSSPPLLLSLSVALWQVSSYGGPAGQIDNSMSRPAPGFYKHHFTASVFVWQTPYNTQYPLCSTTPKFCFFSPFHSPLSFYNPSLSYYCPTSVVLVWDGM